MNYAQHIIITHDQKQKRITILNKLDKIYI